MIFLHIKEESIILDPHGIGFGSTSALQLSEMSIKNIIFPHSWGHISSYRFVHSNSISLVVLELSIVYVLIWQPFQSQPCFGVVAPSPKVYFTVEIADNCNIPANDNDTVGVSLDVDSFVVNGQISQEFLCHEEGLLLILVLSEQLCREGFRYQHYSFFFINILSKADFFEFKQGCLVWNSDSFSWALPGLEIADGDDFFLRIGSFGLLSVAKYSWELLVSWVIMRNCSFIDFLRLDCWCSASQVVQNCLSIIFLCVNWFWLLFLHLKGFWISWSVLLLRLMFSVFGLFSFLGVEFVKGLG